MRMGRVGSEGGDSGADGWTWGATCYVRHLFVPKEMRNKGYGTRLMDRIEAEARSRGCVLIVLESHDFQAPEFYQRIDERCQRSGVGMWKVCGLIQFIDAEAFHAIQRSASHD